MQVLPLCSSNKVFILTIFLACNQLIFGGLYFAASKMSHHFFFLNFLGTGLLYIMMKNSFMFVHHLVCYLDLNEMETQSSHAFSALALPNHFISKFWRSSKVLKQLSFWSPFSPSKLDWMLLLCSSHLIHSYLLSMFCLCLLLSILLCTRPVITNMVPG